ncbi:MAG: glycosyltransferase family 39 protein [Planctomycetota bacterium]
MMELTEKNKNLFNLLTITVIAFCLRLFMLGSQSLWMDEAALYSQTKVDSIFGVYSAVMNEEGHIGPFCHILTYLFCQLFGYSEWALRMPSAIYGTISVILVYKIAELLMNKNVALFSSILLAFSPVHVWYSQEARMYSLWVMLTLLTTFLFVRLLEKGRLWRWALLTILASLCIWTFLYSIFIFAAFGLYLVICFKRYRKELCLYLVCMFVAVASYLPGFIVLLAKISAAPALSIHFMFSI